MAKIRGCLALGCGGAQARLLEPLALAMRRTGWDVQLMDVSANKRAAPLNDARDAYALLALRAHGVAVVGLGAGSTVAMLLAEQYAVSALVCLAPEPGDGRKARSLARLAARNLFAVVAPTLVVQPASGRGSPACGVRRILKGVSASECRAMWLNSAYPLGAPGVERDHTLAAILEHLSRI